MNEYRTRHASSKNEKHVIARLGNHGRRIMTSAKWRSDTTAIRLTAKGKILEGDLAAHLICPRNRRRDPSNYMEFFLDALQGVFYENDKQVRDERTSEHLTTDNKEFIFRIYRLEDILERANALYLGVFNAEVNRKK